MNLVLNRQLILQKQSLKRSYMVGILKFMEQTSTVFIDYNKTSTQDQHKCRC